MSKNKNNKPVWSSRIKQKDISTFQRVSSSLKSLLSILNELPTF